MDLCYYKHVSYIHILMSLLELTQNEELGQMLA